MWSNDECPDLDPIRILFAYLYVIGWKGGSLFPSFEELDDPPADGVYVTKLSEEDLYESLKHIFNKVLKHEEKLGSHTGRKSAYLFAAMQGCRSVASMMEAADHECPKVALRYLQDAEAIMEVNCVFDDPKQRVGTWRSPHSAGGENAVLAAAPGSEFHRPLPQLVIGFIENLVGISPAHRQCRQPKFVFEQVVQWRKPQQDASRQLADQLCHISEDRTNTIMNCVAQMVNSAVLDERKRAHADM